MTQLELSNAGAEASLASMEGIPTDISANEQSQGVAETLATVSGIEAGRAADVLAESDSEPDVVLDKSTLEVGTVFSGNKITPNLLMQIFGTANPQVITSHSMLKNKKIEYTTVGQGWRYGSHVHTKKYDTTQGVGTTVDGFKVEYTERKRAHGSDFKYQLIINRITYVGTEPKKPEEVTPQQADATVIQPESIGAATLPQAQPAEHTVNVPDKKQPGIVRRTLARLLNRAA